MLATLEGVASTKQGKEGWATPEGQNAKRGHLKNTSLRCANGLGSSLTRKEAELLANLYHGLIKDLSRGNNCKAKIQTNQNPLQKLNSNGTKSRKTFNNKPTFK